MDIQPNDPTLRQRAEDPNQHIQHSDKAVEPEDNKAPDDRSPRIPGSDSVHCPKCCGSNIYITVVEPGSTRLYQCEQCRTGFSVEAGTFARGRQVLAVQGSGWRKLDEAGLRDARLIQIVGIIGDLLPRQFDAAGNGQPSVLQPLLERTPGEPEGSQMPVAAGSETTETETEEATASQANDSAPVQAGAQSAATAENPSPDVGAKPQSGKGRQKPGPKNKFDAYWDTDIVPLLEKDPDSKFTADGILNILIDRYPGAIDVNRSINAFKNLADVLRGMINKWRADHDRVVPKRKRKGSKSRASKDPQKHKHKTSGSKPRASKDSKKPNGRRRPRKRGPGQEAQVDFTHLNQLGVKVQGYPVPPLLFNYRFSHSGWTYAEAFGGETVAALSQGFQNALAQSGGVPQRLHRDSHGSAIYCGRPIPPFDVVLDHYGLKLTLSDPGSPWQNGGVERSNGLIKHNLEQILLERGSLDFASLPEFQAVVQRAVRWMNRKLKVRKALAEEREQLRPLPTGTVPSYKPVKRSVKLGWIHLYGCFYGVPYGVGKQVFVRMYDDRIEVYREDPEKHPEDNPKPVKTWSRSHSQGTAQIDFHRVLRALLSAEPTAFKQLPEGVKEAMFPAPAFKETYQRLKTWCVQEVYRNKRRVGVAPDTKKLETHAAYEYFRILDLAADPASEWQVDQALQRLLASGDPFYVEDVERLIQSSPEGAHGFGSRPLH